MNQTVDLSRYNNRPYYCGADIIKRSVWFFVNVLFFLNPLNPLSSLKVWFLKRFGAQIGKGVVIKPSVNIKYPWRLYIGDYVWIGERVWIDNLDDVSIGNNCCVSQGALLLCGNHDYSRSTFDLMTAPIRLEDGVWIGANSVVTGGVRCGSHAVLAVNSVASTDLEVYTVYRGNPAIPTKTRTIKA